MAKGIKVPIEVHNGRFRLEEGDGYISSLIATALGNCDSTNPFQYDLGLGEDIIFDINDDISEGIVRKKVEQVFISFENDQLAELDSLEFSGQGNEKNMVVIYRNLETGARRELEFPLSNSPL